MPAATVADSNATATKAQRQPIVSAMKAGQRACRTDASAHPRKIIVIARPRCSGGASTLIAARLRREDRRRQHADHAHRQQRRQPGMHAGHA